MIFFISLLPNILLASSILESILENPFSIEPILEAKYLVAYAKTTIKKVPLKRTNPKLLSKKLLVINNPTPTTAPGIEYHNIESLWVKFPNLDG